MKRVLFTFAVSHKDAAMALEVSKWMLELGCKFDAPALVVTSKGSLGMPEIAQYVFNLQKVFSSVSHYPLEMEDERVGWYPQNHIFRCTAQYIEHLIKDIDGFYFLEPDCLPVKKDWADMITAAYDATDKPFMGDILRANATDPNSTLHMNGSAVYPQNIVKYCRTMLRHEELPWDFASAEDVLPQACQTNLIQTLFNTINYSQLDGKIITHKPAPDGTLKGKQDAGPEAFVSDEAVVVHGCKDGSLLRILRARHNAKQFRPTPPPTDKAHSVQTAANGHDPVVVTEKAKKQRKAMAKLPLTMEEEKSVKGLVTTMELFCRNEAASGRVRELIRESKLIPV